MDFFDMYPDMFAKTRYYTPDECIAIGNKELQFVLLPNDIRRPNGREYRKLMEIINNDQRTDMRGTDNGRNI